jgi:hypothetical protein
VSNADRDNQHTTQDGRTYTTPFGELPSVTSVLKIYDNGKTGALMGWACKLMAEYLLTLSNKDGLFIRKDELEGVLKTAKAQHKEQKKAAGDLGSEVHNLIEVYLRGQKVDALLKANKLLEKPFEAFLSWHKKEGFEFIACEQQVCTKRFAGTLDGLAKKNGELWVIDFKSSNRIDSTYLWQIAAYRDCAMNGWQNVNGEWKQNFYNVKGGVAVLRLDKVTGLPEFVPYSIAEAEWGLACFNKLLDLWELTNKKGI